MKVSKSIAVIGTAAGLFAASVNADDFNTVINVEQTADVAVSVNQNNVNPKITIQDYIDAANGENSVFSNSIADNKSRWETEKTL